MASEDTGAATPAAAPPADPPPAKPEGPTRDELTAQLQDMESRLARGEDDKLSLKRQLKEAGVSDDDAKDPYRLLAKFGHDPNAMITSLLGEQDRQSDPLEAAEVRKNMKAMQEMVDKQAKQIEDLTGQAKASAERRGKRTVSAEVQQVVQATPDKFPHLTVGGQGAVDYVYSQFAETQKATGEAPNMLNVMKAAEQQFADYHGALAPALATSKATQAEVIKALEAEGYTVKKGGADVPDFLTPAPAAPGAPPVPSNGNTGGSAPKVDRSKLSAEERVKYDLHRARAKVQSRHK